MPARTGPGTASLNLTSTCKRGYFAKCWGTNIAEAWPVPRHSGPAWKESPSIISEPKPAISKALSSSFSVLCRSIAPRRCTLCPCNTTGVTLRHVRQPVPVLKYCSNVESPARVVRQNSGGHARNTQQLAANATTLKECYMTSILTFRGDLLTSDPSNANC